LPEAIKVGAQVRELAAGAEAVLSVLPTQFLRPTLQAIAASLPPRALYVSCTKGFERGSLELPSHILRSLLPGARAVILSGPSHAEEVSRDLPAAVVLGSERPDWAQEAQRLLAGPRFRVYTSGDPVGVEVAGAVKNVIAIAAGIADGLGFGDNTRAALLTRGLREMGRLGLALGARSETFAGLAGMGDLIATCTSQHSRNRSVGWRLAGGESLAQILASMSKVAEGVETARTLPGLAERFSVAMPISEQVHEVLFRAKPPRQAVESLMARETRNESE
jgi:glycerol-3-phosphate dehydrogenase (NAD(P)+)